MKIQCDVCKGEEAAVFCCADEAALCGACDGSVHCANKLAGKHRRFSLLHPSSPQQFPICDICKEKRAFVFCHEDRAILCRDCDFLIHNANDLTKKHSRFLLTGIKLSPSATTAASDAPGSVAVSPTASDFVEEPPGNINNVNGRRRAIVDAAPKQQKKHAIGVPPAASEVADEHIPATATTATGFTNSKVMTADDRGLWCGISTTVSVPATGGGSSISEYLIKELPGWGVEDLLMDSTPAIHAATFPFSKMTGDDRMPFLEADLDAAGGTFPADDGGNISSWWVPQVPQVSPASLPPLPPAHDYDDQRQHTMGTGTGSELGKLTARHLEEQYQRNHQHHRWVSDDCFTVPEITTVQLHHDEHSAPSSYKRPRPAPWCISS